jgi:hypothetical protein
MALAGLSGKQQLLVRVSFLCNVALCIIKIVAAVTSGSFAVRDAYQWVAPVRRSSFESRVGGF